MSSNVGESTIVTNGLVLYLDAANYKSYTSGSTVWRDTSYDGITGSFINSPTFNSANLGTIQFDGVDDYIQLQNSSTYKVQFPLTIDCFFNVQDLTNYGTIIRNDNTSLNHWGVIITINYVSNFGSDYTISVSYGNGTANAPSGRRSYTTALTINQNQWYYFACVLPDNLNCEGYLNGNSISIPYSAGSANTLVYGSGAGVIGYRTDPGVSPYFKGNISNIRIYNRALSATEVLQNYNALKGRFGLT